MINKLIILLCAAVIILFIAVICLIVSFVKQRREFVKFREISVTNDSVFVEGFKQHIGIINQNKEMHSSDINSLYDSVKLLDSNLKRIDNQISLLNNKIDAIILSMKQK